MERNLQRTGLVNMVVLLVLALFGFAVARYCHSFSGQITSVFLLFGFLAAAVSAFQARLEERERLEALEFEEMARKSASAGTSLFNTAAADNFPARHSREQFEKFFVPGFTLLLFLLQAAGAYFLWRWLNKPTTVMGMQPVMALGVFGFAALTLFLMGKYSAGLVRLERQHLLSPSASYLLLGAYLFALVAIALVLVLALDLHQVDKGLARALSILLMLLAVESFIALLLEVYRPRIKGKATRILYESRLVGLLSHPEGLITTAAQALDYQFGFKVSETWFYRFMERALPWMILAQLAVLTLSTSFVFVQTGEEALLERFGKPVPGRGVIGPGFHLKFPWPIDRVQRFRTREIQTLNIGFEHDEEEKDPGQRVILWTVSHAREEFLLLVASRGSAANTATNDATGKKPPPVNLLSASIPVQYQISDLNAWAYSYSDARKLLEDVATREVVRYLVSADFQEIMSTARAKASSDLAELIQARVDQLKLGAKIIFVGLPDIHPPVAVAAAYEAVVGARQKREAALLTARAHAIQTNALASAEAQRKRRQAEAARQRLEVIATAEAVRFVAQIPAFQASPEVYTQRAYLETLARSSRDARKIIIATTNTTDVIQLDLEEKIRPDMLDFKLSAP